MDAVSSWVRRLNPGQVVLDGVLAVVSFGILGLVGLGRHDGVLGGWPAAVLLAAAVLLRRLSPWSMVMLAVAGGTIQLVGADASVGSGLVLALLFATTGNDPDRRIRLAGLAAALVASLGGGLAAGTHGLIDAVDHPDGRVGLVTGVQIAVVAGAAWLVGFVRHQRRVTAEARIAERIARIEEQRSADLLVHEQERTRIARDMHDVVAHTLAVVVAQAEGARYAMTQHPDAVERSLRTIAETCRGSLGDVRRLLGELRGDQRQEPSDLPDRIPDDDALFDRLRLAGLYLDVDEVGERRTLAEPQASAAQWVLTEALTNALKHGVAQRPVTLQRTWSEELELTVANFVPAGTRSSVGGHGLTGVAERVRLVGGSSEYHLERSGEGQRFVLHIRLPYDAGHDRTRGR